MRLSAAYGGRLRSVLERVRQRTRDLLPATRKIGALLERAARRRAPIGDGPGRGAGNSLRSSINHHEPAHDTTVLRSDKAYARIQDVGGVIFGGSPRSKIAGQKPKWLAVPVSDRARQLLASLGASQSLRDLDLFLVESKGRFLLCSTSLGRGRLSSKFRRNRQGKIKAVTRVEKTEQGLFEVLFVLKPSVRIRGHKYVPRVREEPLIASQVADILRRYLRTGT